MTVSLFHIKYDRPQLVRVKVKIIYVYHHCYDKVMVRTVVDI
jgi:hypothetical protein